MTAKKVLATLLAVVMILTSFGMTALADEAATPTEGYLLTIYNADGTVGHTIDGTKSISDFNLRTSIADADVFVNNAFLFGIETPVSYEIEFYEDAICDQAVTFNYNTTIKGNGHKILWLGEGESYYTCAEGVTLTENDLTIAKPPVAKVGNTEYEKIEDAVAAWINNTTLTLLADVTLTDVIKLKSTEMHTLNLGTYTMTAAKNQNAIEITPEGRSSASYALDIKADATNPGGITATGKACFYTKGKSGVKDRPIIRIYGGVFNASNVIYHSGSNGTNCPQYQIFGGTFNGSIFTNRVMLNIFGGTFNAKNNISPDSSAYTRIEGGRFYDVGNNMMSALNADKWTYGTAKGNFNVDVYVDADGYYVVDKNVSEKPGAFEASIPTVSGTLVYSKAYTEGLYYTDAEVAFAKNSNVKLYTALDAEKTVSGTMTLDCTAENAAFTGKIDLSGSGKFEITYANAERFDEFEVYPETGCALEVERVVNDDGSVTYTYSSGELKDLSLAEAKVVDGEKETYYKSPYSALYAVDGTKGKTIVLLKDAIGATLITNGRAVGDKSGVSEITLDLNGFTYAPSACGTGNQAEFNLTIVDSSEAKTGTVGAGIANLKLARNGENDYSGFYKLCVKGGTYSINPDAFEKDGVTYDFTPEGYAAKANADGTYTVDFQDAVKVEFDPAAPSADATVYIQDEEGNVVPMTLTVALEEGVSFTDANEQLVTDDIFLSVQLIDDAEIHTAADVLLTDNDRIYDIEFVNAAGEEVEFTGKATVKIPYDGADWADYKVYHVADDGTFTDMQAVYNTDEKAFVFVAEHFSIYTLAKTLEENITEAVTLTFKPTADARVYEMYIASTDGKLIYRMSDAQFKLALEANAGESLTYKLKPAANVAITTSLEEEDVYLYNFDGVNVADKIATEILIGTVEFTGYGTFKFGATDYDKSEVNAAELFNNKVKTYTVNGANEFVVPAMTDEITYTVAKRDVEITLDFTNNITAGNVADYNDMTVTMVASNGDTYVGKVGSGSDADVQYKDGAATVTFEFEVVADLRYNITVEGAGYRTANYSTLVKSGEGTVAIKFWNNAQDNDKALEVEEDVAESKEAVTFLAGDIVGDGVIDIYDLSAAVSYFGQTLNVAGKDMLVKYDLNRDGRIDARDVAYVLVSWGK